MLEKFAEEVKSIAITELEKAAGEKELPQEVIDYVNEGADTAIEKLASIGIIKNLAKNVGDATKDSSSLWSAAAQKVGTGLTAAAMGAGFLAGGKAFKTAEQKMKYNSYKKSLEQAVMRSHVLKDVDKAKLERFGETIFKFAPNVSTDPNLLATILANAVQGDTLDVMTIRTLADLEKRYQDQTSVNLNNVMV